MARDELDDEFDALLDKEFDSLNSADVPGAPAWASNIKGKYEPQLGRPPQGELPPTSAGEAATLAGTQGFFQGFGNQLLGLGNVLNLANPPGNEVETYRAGRDAGIEADRRAEADHPVLYPLVEAGGSIASSPVAGPVNSVGTAARTGGILGGINAVGRSEGDLTKGEVGEVAKDAAVGTGLGTLFGTLGYGAAKGAGWAGDKVRDATTGLKYLFGKEVPVDLTRAATTLGSKGAPVKDPLIGDALESEMVNNLPPSLFNKASPSAPEAVARVGSNPRVQAAEASAKAEIRQGLRSARDQNAKAVFQSERVSPQTTQVLEDLAAGKIGRPQLDLVKQFLRLKGKVNPTEFVDDQNLVRAMTGPKARELALLLNAGFEQNLSADAVSAIASRISALIGASSQEAGSAVVDALQ